MTVAEQPKCCSWSQSSLIDHRLVNCSVEALKFQAAASYQIPALHLKNCPHDKKASEDDLLVTSPYTQSDHLFDLKSVSKANQILAKALTVLRPIRDDYATCSYRDAFNWPYVIATLRELCQVEKFHFIQEPETFYIVVFRSQVPPSTDRSHLAELDKKAHKEAVESGGLLKYWFGVPDAEGFNLATCVWRYRSDAINGSKGEGHKAAMMATRGLYSFWKVDRLQLAIEDGAEKWDIIDWKY